MHTAPGVTIQTTDADKFWCMYQNIYLLGLHVYHLL